MALPPPTTATASARASWIRLGKREYDLERRMRHQIDEGVERIHPKSRQRLDHDGTSMSERVTTGRIRPHPRRVRGPAGLRAGQRRKGRGDGV